jgi:hypothetical protein
MRRLQPLLVAGCLAAGAASALGDLGPLQRAGLAGIALLAALLVLRGARTRAVDARGRDPEAPAPPRRPGSRRRRTQALDERLAAITQRIDAFQAELARVSRAHTLAEVATNDQLTDLQRHLAELEATNLTLGRELETLRRQQIRHLARLRSTVAGQREALSLLQTTLGTTRAGVQEQPFAGPAPAEPNGA